MPSSPPLPHPSFPVSQSANVLIGGERFYESVPHFLMPINYCASNCILSEVEGSIAVPPGLETRQYAIIERRGI